MKRPLTIGAVVVVCLALLWVALMSYLNTRSATLDVHVAGQVERVEFFREGRPDSPVATIVTHGRDTDTTLSLPSAARFSFLKQSEPAQYYFVATWGGQSEIGRRVCCSTGAPHGTLTIRELGQWEQSWQD